eukprot:s1025_g11.t1
MNGKNVGLGGNMNLWHLRDAQLGSQGSRDQGSVWPLELVGLRNHEGLLSSLVRRSWIQGPEPLELNKFHVRDWQLHVQRDHIPYRKDCRTCIERASGKPHRRVTHPSAYCLFIDTAGPFRNVGAGGYNKYLLVGCYRHPKLPGTNPEEELAKATEEADVLPRPDEGDDWLGEDKEAAAGGKILRRWNLKVALVSLIQENLFVTLKRQLRIRRHCGDSWEFTSITVARDLCTEVHSDRFNLRNSNLRNSTNYVLTLCHFQGGGIWQQGADNELADVAVESSTKNILQGFVTPVKNRIVKVDPKRPHRTMPWTGGPKWTVIAHTIGARGKLAKRDVEALRGVGFPVYAASLDALSVEKLRMQEEAADVARFDRPWRHLLSGVQLEEEMMNRLWTRRVLDEEEQLMQVAQWLGLCRLTESEEETFGVETMLEELREPLKVVFTVALDEVKNCASRWSEAMHKEVKALLDAGASWRRLGSWWCYRQKMAEGVFTAKPPGVERLEDANGVPLPRGSPHFVKRKARLAICGNFQGRQAREDCYAGGCQIDSLRAMLVLAALRGWCLASTDRRNAFILAPIKDDEEDDDGTVYGLFPPRVFQMVTEWLLGECEESVVDHTAEQLRRAQFLTGELLWLSGRSRPDITHSVSTMSSLCVKNPELVERIGLRVLGYLKATAGVCLWYRPTNVEYEVLGYSDASFAPLGARSVGCSVACYYRCPVSWRCGRQSIVSLSVAEAELLEAVNCVQLMLGLPSFVKELQSTKPRHCLRMDNQAAVGLTTESAGTWKTRHFRVRAFALREAVRQEEHRISHIEGLRQLGDLGTKCFHKPKLEQLRDLWGLWDSSGRSSSLKEDTEPAVVGPKASSATLAVNGVAGVLAKLTLILGWLVQGSRASEVGQNAGLELSFAWELHGLAILAVIAAIGVWELIKWFLGRRFGTSDELQESKEARRLRKQQQVVHEQVGKYA